MVFSTTLCEQYSSLKAAHPDAVLLMQVGTFMQVMNDDARQVSAVTGLKLKMAGDVDAPVVVGGFPKSGLDMYVGKLVRAAVVDVLLGTLSAGRLASAGCRAAGALPLAEGVLCVERDAGGAALPGSVCGPNISGAVPVLCPLFARARGRHPARQSLGAFRRAAALTRGFLGTHGPVAGALPPGCAHAGKAAPVGRRGTRRLDPPDRAAHPRHF